MRYITKGEGGRHLNRQHQNPPTDSDSARRAWERYRYTDETREICYREQLGLCGYTEVELKQTVSIFTDDNDEVSYELGFHLEHVEPKSINPQRTFDHQNLIASAIINAGVVEQLRKEDVFGGHAKQSWFDEGNFIHPLLADCEAYFHYQSSTGKVTPKISLSPENKQKADTTIAKLNLNSPVLVLWRKTWFEQALTIVDGLLDSEQALEQFAQMELLPINGCLRPFHTGMKQLFGALGDTICRDI